MDLSSPNSRDQIDEKDLKGLRAFAQDYKEAKLFVFYGGKQREYREGITLIPVQDALPSLPELM